MAAPTPANHRLRFPAHVSYQLGAAILARPHRRRAPPRDKLPPKARPPRSAPCWRGGSHCCPGKGGFLPASLPPARRGFGHPRHGSAPYQSLLVSMASSSAASSPIAPPHCHHVALAQGSCARPGWSTSFGGEKSTSKY